MSAATRWMVGLLFIAIPTIAFGGYFLLSILRRNAGTEGITDVQRTWAVGSRRMRRHLVR